MLTIRASASSPNSFSTLKTTSGENCHFTGVIADAHCPIGPEKLHQSDLPLREGRQKGRWSTERAALSLFQRSTCLLCSAAVSPSFWSSSYFLWFCSHILLTHIVKQHDNGSHVSKLKAFNSSTSEFTFSSTIHLPKTPPPSGLPTSTPPSSKLALYFLCQTPPKSFTNPSELLASCALQFTWIVSCDL